MAHSSIVKRETGNQLLDPVEFTPVTGNANYSDYTRFKYNDVWAASLQRGVDPEESNSEGEIYAHGLPDNAAIPIPTSNNDEISIAAISGITVCENESNVGSDYNAVAATVTVTRGTTDPFIRNVLVWNETSGFEIIAGLEGTAFSSDYGVAGGYPFVGFDSVIVADIKLSSTTAGLVKKTEISTARRQLSSNRPEFFPIDSETVDEILIGTGRSPMARYNTPEPLVHTGGTPRKLFIKFAVPIMSQSAMGGVTDFMVGIAVKASNDTPVFGGRFVSTTTTSLQKPTFNILTNERAGLGNQDLKAIKEKGKLWYQWFPRGLQFGEHYLQEPCEFSVSAPSGTAGSGESTFALTGLTESYALQKESEDYLL